MPSPPRQLSHNGGVFSPATGYESSIGYNLFVPLDTTTAITDSLLQSYQQNVEALTGGLEYGSVFVDDFQGGSLSSAWSTTTTGSATITVPAGWRNGVVQLSTGATSGSAATLQMANTMFDPASNPFLLFKFQIKSGSVTTNLGVSTLGWAGDYINMVGIGGVFVHSGGQKLYPPVPINYGTWIPVKMAKTPSALNLYYGNVCVSALTATPISLDRHTLRSRTDRMRPTLRSISIT